MKEADEQPDRRPCRAEDASALHGNGDSFQIATEKNSPRQTAERLSPSAPSLHQKAETPRTLFTRDFAILFLLFIISNSQLAVYYCFEQWLGSVAVGAQWRGFLLGILFGVITVVRPCASISLLSRSKLVPVTVSYIASSLVLIAYQFLTPSAPEFIWIIFVLRFVHGTFYAILSSCMVSEIVSTFPPGQSARGFAFFSLSNLLPYALIPSIGEAVLPVIGGPTALFTVIGSLGLPALFLIRIIAPRLKKPELTAEKNGEGGVRAILQTALHSRLSLIFLACFFFCMTTNTGLFFMKGLCTETGGNPAIYYSAYTGTMIIIRLIGNAFFDRLPPYTCIPACAAVMAAAYLALAWLPLSFYLPASILFGLALSLLYPLLASIICNRSTPETRTLNSNFMMSTFDITGLVAPVVGGIFIDTHFGYRGIFTCAAGFISVCGLCVLIDALYRKWHPATGKTTAAR